MKKFIILLFLFSSLAFTFSPPTDLQIKMCDWLEECRDLIHGKYRFSTEDLFWTAEEKAVPGQSFKYPVYMEKDVRYVYYGVSDGPEIRLCYSKARRGAKKECNRFGSNQKVCFMIVPEEDGNYFVYIDTIKGTEGKHVSYMTYVYNAHSKIPQQRDYR